MKQPYLFCYFVIFIISLSSAQAQFHFQGLKGIMLAYGIHRDVDSYYSLGYQAFLSDRFQGEISGAWQNNNFLHATLYPPYHVTAAYRVNSFLLQETVDYSFLKLFNRVYVNIGAGLTQAYEHARATEIDAALDSALLETTEEISFFDEKAVRPLDKVSLGGHANILTEVYLSRYLTLLLHYRYTYFLKSHFEKTLQQTTLGIRFNL